MSDPRLNDPRFGTRIDPRPADPARDPAFQPRTGANPTWMWIGGLAAVVLIAILVLGNWHTGTDTGTPVTANTPSITAPAGTPPARDVTPRSTTGSGSTSPAPAQPAAPAPNPQ